MSSEEEDRAYKRFAEDYGNAWAPKATRIAAAIAKAEAEKAAAEAKTPARRRKKEVTKST